MTRPFPQAGKAAVLALAAVAIVALAAAACGGGGEEEGDNAEQTPTTTATLSQDEVTLDLTVDAVFLFIRQRQRDRLRDLLGEELRQRVEEADLERLANCIPEGAVVQVASKELKVSADTATVKWTFLVTKADGSSDEVKRTWKFERRADGTWALSELPECPYD